MTSWRPLDVRYSKRAEKDLRRAGRPVAQRVRDMVMRYAETGDGDVKRLRSSEEEYRLRVGSWRVRFTVELGKLRVMLVLRVAPRGDVYR